MFAYYVLGLLLGTGSSVLPGPCGLAVIGAATRLGKQRAVATAIGSGLGDLAYASLGVLAIGHVLARDPELVSSMVAVGGVALIVYGLACLRRRPAATRAAVRPVGGVAVGFLALACNPGVLVMWSAIGLELAGATRAQQTCAVLGIASGSVVWFVGIANLSVRGKDVLGARMDRIVQLVGGSIIAYGVASLVRAAL